MCAPNPRASCNQAFGSDCSTRVYSWMPGVSARRSLPFQAPFLAGCLFVHNAAASMHSLPFAIIFSPLWHCSESLTLIHPCSDPPVGFPSASAATRGYLQAARGNVHHHEFASATSNVLDSVSFSPCQAVCSACLPTVPRSSHGRQRRLCAERYLAFISSSWLS